MDRRHLSLAREAEPRFDLLIPAETEAVLLVEQEGDDPLEVRGRLHRLVGEMWQQKRLAFGARQAFEDGRDRAVLAAGRQGAAGAVSDEGPSRPVPIVEDMAVPPEVLPEFLVRMQNVLKRHQVTASLFCHAGQGQLHVQPFLDLANPDDVRADAAAGRGALRRKCSPSSGTHRRRTRLRAEPHGLRRASRPASCSTCSAK